MIKEHDYKTDLEKLQIIAFVPMGNSMWPMLKNNGQSVVVEKKKERLNKYDVAFYVRESGKYVLHRVVEVKDDGYIMQGDSQGFTEFIKEQNVFGKMLGFYKGKKYIQCTDEKYIKKVEKWHKGGFCVKLKLKIFYFKLKIKKIFCKIFKQKNKRG